MDVEQYNGLTIWLRAWEWSDLEVEELMRKAEEIIGRREYKDHE